MYHDENLNPEQKNTQNDLTSKPMHTEMPREENAKDSLMNEYHLKRENVPYRAYTDARYTPVDETPAVPQRQYYYQGSDARQKDTDKNNSRREKKHFSMPQVVALCLSCALLTGAGSVLGFTMMNNSNKNPDASAAGVVAPAYTTPTPTMKPANTPLVKTANNGAVLSAKEIYQLACPQTVGITADIPVYDYFGQASTSTVSGSGFILTSDGYIATNYHVIQDAVAKNAKIIVRLHDGNTYEATVIGHEEENDVAVLKIDASDLSAVTLANSDEMQVGETVYAVGNPLGELSYSMTSGMLSALDRQIQTSASNGSNSQIINMFQFDAAVNSGNSGGPVYNDRGEVVGIVTAKYSSTGVEGLSFAIPMNDAASIIDELIENGYVSGKAALGVSVNPVDAAFIQYYNLPEGAYVVQINENSAAAQAGLKPGDIIVRVADTEVNSPGTLRSAIRQFKAGDAATVEVYRSGEYITLSVVFEEAMPAQSTPEDTQQQMQPGDGAQSGQSPEDFFFPFR